MLVCHYFQEAAGHPGDLESEGVLAGSKMLQPGTRLRFRDTEKVRSFATNVCYCSSSPQQKQPFEIFISRGLQYMDCVLVSSGDHQNHSYENTRQ